MVQLSFPWLQTRNNKQPHWVHSLAIEWTKWKDFGQWKTKELSKEKFVMERAHTLHL